MTWIPPCGWRPTPFSTVWSGRGATFSSGDARRLIALVPMTRASRFSFVGTLTGRGGRLRGDAAGVGPVDLEGEGEGQAPVVAGAQALPDRGL